MSSYQYTYPVDENTFIDENTDPGPIRDAAHRIVRASREHGGDLWDLVEDDSQLSDDEKDQVHRVFGGDESVEELAAKRAAGVRYDR